MILNGDFTGALSMQATVERNEPCPCGSGKKYKRCCLSVPSVQTPIEQDTDWLCMRRCEGETVNTLIDFLMEEFNPDILMIAAEEFTFLGTFDLDEGIREQLFLYWYLFNWRVPLEKEKEETTIAKLCLRDYPERFSSYQKQFIRQISCSPFTFYLIQDVVPGRRLALKDILLQQEVIVKEMQGTQNARKGMILYGRHVTLDGQSILVGLAPGVLLNHCFSTIIELRQRIQEDRGLQHLAEQDLEALDEPIRLAYFTLSAIADKPISLTNSDQEPLIMHDIFYDLTCAPREAFDKLRSLCPDEMQEPCDRRRKQNFSLPWARIHDRSSAMENTILGHLTIKGAKLHVSVNSENRAKHIQREIQQRLGNAATLVKIETISCRSSEEVRSFKPRSRPRAPLQITGELREKVKTLNSKYYVDWLDKQIPALGGVTPRQAAQTPEGREKLEALLLQFEASSQASAAKNEDWMTIDTEFLKRELGLSTMLAAAEK